MELKTGRIIVDHWGCHRADLRPFFKAHRLARPEIEVVLQNRKKETITTQFGDSFLYGVPFASDFDLETFHRKWKKRFEKEADDLEAAPSTRSGFAWDGIEDGMIPWVALKSAWRRGAGRVCQNCSGITVLTNFGLRPVGMFNRAAFLDFVCGTCQRSFKDESVNMTAWMAANLDDCVQPEAELIWGHRVKRRSDLVAYKYGAE